MKKLILQLILIFTLLFSPFIYATDPDNQVDAGTIEDPDSPIDGNLIWLAFAGIAFAVYYYNTKSKKNIA